MTDEELLFKAMKLCNSYKTEQGKCSKKCPLYDMLCLNNEGSLYLNDHRGTVNINFVEFTEQFRKMIEIITKGK